MCGFSRNAQQLGEWWRESKQLSTFRDGLCPTGCIERTKVHGGWGYQQEEGEVRKLRDPSRGRRRWQWGGCAHFCRRGLCVSLAFSWPEHMVIAASWRNRCCQMWVANELQADGIPQLIFLLWGGPSWPQLGHSAICAHSCHNCQSMPWGHAYLYERKGSIPTAQLECWFTPPLRSVC